MFFLSERPELLIDTDVPKLDIIIIIRYNNLNIISYYYIIRMFRKKPKNFQDIDYQGPVNIISNEIVDGFINIISSAI